MGSKNLTKEEIKHIADLIKIYIPSHQLDSFREQLDTALCTTEVFDELDLEEVEETSTSIGTINVYRDDFAEAGLTQKEALQNADNCLNGNIVIQRVVRK